MKQLLQSAKTGEARVEDLPAPGLRAGCVLVENRASLVSAGTERMVVEFSRQSLLAKARSRPDLVKRVVEKARTEGVLTAFDAAMTRLDQPIALGYSAAGVVVEVGEGVEGVRAGDPVACAGGGYAVHAEVLCVPRNLIAPLPVGVPFEAGAFTTVGAIGLHGFRLAELQLGESVVVLGLGLIGLLTAQIARAAGCRVLGVDLDPARVDVARALGMDAVAGGREDDEGTREATLALSAGRGVDAVLVTAATPDSGPVRLAGDLCRDRGRVVAVGAVGMDIPRRTYYEKELDFRISRSYGPGRYDPTYEDKGVDYPIGYVRWTQGRNLGSFVDLMARGLVETEPLVTHRFPIAGAERAYALITGERSEPFLGVLITYPEGAYAKAAAPPTQAEPDEAVHAREAPPEKAVAATGVHDDSSSAGRRIDLASDARDSSRGGGLGIGLLGAGTFVTGTLLPAIADVEGTRLVGVCSASGASSAHAGRKYGFDFATTNESELLGAEAVEAVIVATRHDLHPRQVVSALSAGKHVFCEKPPAIDADGLADIVRAVAAADGSVFTVGYNRRFAPMAAELAAFLRPVEEPLVANYRVNAGPLPVEHWLNDPDVGGGRIIGELCHFADFLVFVTGALPVRVHARGMSDRGGRWADDNVAVTVDFADGSVGTVSYVARGDRAMGKERCEVFCGGGSAVLDDFRVLDLYRSGRRTRTKSRLRQDKGHRGEWRAFIEGVAQGAAPIPLPEIVGASLVTFAAIKSLKSGEPTDIDAQGFISDALAGGAGR